MKIWQKFYIKKLSQKNKNMKQKFFLTISLFFIFFGTFGLRESWGIVGNPCCPDSTWTPNGVQCIKTGQMPIDDNCLDSSEVCNIATKLCESQIPSPSSVSLSPASPFDPCKNLSDSGNDKSLTKCRQCTGIKDDGTFTGKCPEAKGSASCGTWTSLGCIPNDPANLVGWILGLGSGIAGGIAFLLILFGAGQIVLSGGVPEKIAAGKEIITSAVIGLVFIFVSVLVLQIIGVKILGIPGWS